MDSIRVTGETREDNPKGLGLSVMVVRLLLALSAS